MPLAQGGIAGQEIKISFSFHVPNINTFSLLENDRQGMIVVRTKLPLTGDVIFRSHLHSDLKLADCKRFLLVSKIRNKANIMSPKRVC